jgi:hypothetical protein
VGCDSRNGDTGTAASHHRCELPATILDQHQSLKQQIDLLIGDDWTAMSADDGPRLSRRWQ